MLHLVKLKYGATWHFKNCVIPVLLLLFFLIFAALSNKHQSLNMFNIV